MSDLVLACVQSQQFWEDKAANFAHFDGMLVAEKLSDVDVLVFPEMFHTGFSMNAEVLAEEMHGSPGITWLQDVAAKHDCLTIASLIIKDEVRFFNRMVACYPQGEMAWYDKAHLFSLAGEDSKFTAGTARQIIPFRNWKINLQVCYDLRFPESCRNAIGADGLAEYDLLVYVANWPQKRITHWDTLIPARAIENQCYVAAVNRVGEDGNGIVYDGHSMVVNAMGEKEACYGHGEELLFKTALSLEKLVATRKMIPFLKDKK